MNILGKSEELNALSAAVLLKLILGKNKLNKDEDSYAKELSNSKDLSYSFGIIIFSIS